MTRFTDTVRAAGSRIVASVPMASLSGLKGDLRGFYEERVARYIHKQCRIRPDDIIVGSFDRSGRTWVRFFVAAYVSHYFRMGMRVDWSNYAHLTPGTMCKRENLIQFPRTDIHRVLFSHRKSVGRYFPDRRVVYVARRFLDILVSYYFYHKNRAWQVIRSPNVAAFVRDEFDFREAIDRINYFSRQIEKTREVLILPYESLKQETESRFRGLVDFIDYGYDEAAFRAALEHSSFDSMQRMEVEYSPESAKDKLHARRSKTNAFKEHFDEDLVAFVQDRLSGGLRGVLKEYYL